MSKIRSDSIWNSLAPERRKIFVEWLFDECIGYAEAKERAEKEWGVIGSLASVGRFYRRMKEELLPERFAQAAELSESVQSAPGKLNGLRASTMKVIGMQMLEQAVHEEDVKQLATLGRVLTQVEDREIQRGRLALARDRFQFKAAREALKHAPLLNKMSENKQAQQDAEMDETRLAIFGTPPDNICYPEELG